MRTRNILLVSVLVALYGCQPEAPVQQAATPAAAESPASPPPAAQEPQPVANTEAAPAQHTEPAIVKKAVQPVAAEKPLQAAPAPAVVAPVAKAEPVPVAEAESPVSEAEAMQLAKKSNCLACHAIGKKVIGPAWKDVAAKYRGDTGAEARIINKIAKGGSGVWGVMVMPPSPQVSEADRKILAKFVLSLK